MRTSGWSLPVLTVCAMAACDTAPVDPGTADGTSDGTRPVAASVLGLVPVLNEADGHRYEAVLVDDGITWADAKTAAESTSDDGCQGYLVSITSQEENDFIAANLPDAIPFAGSGYWIGAEQPPGSAEPAGGWSWVSGETFAYDNWTVGQPDDSSPLGPEAGEDAAHFTGGTGGFGFSVEPTWSDLNRAETTPGYVVEYDVGCTLADVLDPAVLVKPGDGDEPPPINSKSQGKIAVVVLSTGDGVSFDATAIEPATVTLGDGEDDDDAPVATNKHGKPMASWEDVDGDGLDDAVLHFLTQDLMDDLANGGFVSAEIVVLTLQGEANGTSFAGTDEVLIR